MFVKIEEDAFNHGYKLMNNHAEHIGIRRHSIFLQYNSMKCKSMKAHCKKQRQKFDNLAKFAFFFFFFHWKVPDASIPETLSI